MNLAVYVGTGNKFNGQYETLILDLPENDIKDKNKILECIRSIKNEPIEFFKVVDDYNNIYFECVEKYSQDNKFFVTIDWYGEGIKGNYNKNDPEDYPLLRYIAYSNINGELKELASYCMDMSPLDSKEDINNSLNLIVKRLCEEELNDELFESLSFT